MVKFGSYKDCDLARSAANIPNHQKEELSDQNKRATALLKRLYEQNVPGVILADAVGKGKTYVALGVAFAVLAEKRRGRVLVLTHSRHMAKTWQRRWSEEMKEKVSQQWRECVSHRWKSVVLSDFESFRSHYVNQEPPAIGFASYDTLKKYYDSDRETALVYSILSHVYSVFRLRLSSHEKRALIKQVTDFDFRRRISRIPISSRKARGFLSEHFDPKRRAWKQGSRSAFEDDLDALQAEHINIQRALDLLIIDEAHKMAGTQRGRVIERLLRKDFHKCILVTATPFALSLNQLRERLLAFRHSKDRPTTYSAEMESLKTLFGDFEKAVRHGEDFPRKGELEATLRRYLVRSSWSQGEHRKNLRWEAEGLDVEAILPTFALERVIGEGLEGGSRTHISSRRESLCSSWAAAAKSLEGFQQATESSVSWVSALAALLRRGKGSPKADARMLKAVDELAHLAEKGEKAVVFVERVETARQMEGLLRVRLSQQTQQFKKRTATFRRRLELFAQILDVPYADGLAILKVMTHSFDCPTRWDVSSIRRWWRKYEGELTNSSQPTRMIVGRGRQLPLVARFGQDTKEESYTIEKFSLPCSPFILIATPRAQEGIDLHRHCRRVVLYDLNWNPAILEQRIGRVHRLGGHYSKNKKVEVIVCFQRGTYSEVIMERAQHRLKMMHVLLGAGTWLEADEEVHDLDRYRMSFLP